MSLRSLLSLANQPEARARLPQSGPFGTLQREIDRVFEDFSRGMGGFPTSDVFPRMDVTEHDNEIEITAELPGLEEKDVEVTLSDNMLTVKGEKREEREEKTSQRHMVERSYGTFSRTVELPAGVDPATIKATMNKGVLRLTMPKPTQSNARRIEVKGTP
jgi:HSP20 family protein